MRSHGRAGGRPSLAAQPRQTETRPAGRSAYRAMTVSVTTARELIGEQDLLTISETPPTPVLRVEPRKAEAAA